MDMKNELCSYPTFLNPDKQAFKETHIAKFCTIYSIYHINSPLIYFRISSFIFEWEVKLQSGTSAENYSQTNLPTHQSMLPGSSGLQQTSAEASNPNTLSGPSSQFIDKFAWKC